MDCAASRGYEQLVSLLIKADADVDPHDKSKVYVHGTYVYSTLASRKESERRDSLKKGERRCCYVYVHV